VVIAVLLAVPAGFSSLLLINTSNALGLTPLTFGLFTGKINNHPLADALFIVPNPGLAITKPNADTLFLFLPSIRPYFAHNFTCYMKFYAA